MNLQLWLKLGLIVLAVNGLSRAADHPFVNWETPPVHPLDISPNRTTLAVAITADNRIDIFDVSAARAKFKYSVIVGIDPVTVRFRNDQQLWVVNHISDSLSVIDLIEERVISTISTANEPTDIVFAGSPQKAYVSASEANQIQVFDPLNTTSSPINIDILGEDPRSLAVSIDGTKVYAAIYESGNKSTILAGGIEDANTLSGVPNVTRLPETPYQGEAPPPNAGAEFNPPMTIGLPDPPQVGMIVKQNAQGQWMDDNGQDWSAFISGEQSVASGRVAGWHLLDHDIAIIDTSDQAVTYIDGLMNIGMSLAVNPVSGNLSLVGTDATNEIRFEPVLKGKFIRVNIAMVDAQTQQVNIRDLNAHLDYMNSQVSDELRDLSIGDPRGIIWSADGQRAYVSGMGSNNLVIVDANGERINSGKTIELPAGPTGMALDDVQNRLYIWNRFDSSLTTLDTASLTVITSLKVFDPTPEAIKLGRPFFYDTHLSSGLGQIACASCHIDGRMDRLAWDLGDPAGEMADFDGNCQTNFLPATDCFANHPMKGPMTTQTMQDIIEHEPFHWRADRAGIEAFNPAFVGLQGRGAELSASQMASYKGFLATIQIPPNPFRNIDNSLPTDVDLSQFTSSGRFSEKGSSMPSGNAVRGLALYNEEATVALTLRCSSCHTLPTGMGAEGAIISGGGAQPLGPNQEHHLGVVGIDGSTNRTIKIPQLRNLYEKTGFDMNQQANTAGFGFLHDGSFDSLPRFVSASAFDLNSEQEVADIIALLLAFSGSDLPTGTVGNLIQPLGPSSNDAHAGTGAQMSIESSDQIDTLSRFMEIADNAQLDLIAHQRNSERSVGYLYKIASKKFQVDDASDAITLIELGNLAQSDNPVRFTLVSSGLGERLSLDSDGDGVLNGVEATLGSDPLDAESTNLLPLAGLWSNPERSGHGFDLQSTVNGLFMIWYTYLSDGTPVWYIAQAPFTGSSWSAELVSSQWDFMTGKNSFEVVGSVQWQFADKSNAQVNWTLNGAPGEESMKYLQFSPNFTVSDYTGSWFSPTESGYGMSINTQGESEAVVLYYYDATGQSRWLIGAGLTDSQSSFTMQSSLGFCPSCEFMEPQFTDAGTLSRSFINLRSGTADINVSYPGAAGGDWIRQSIEIVPLSIEVQ